MKKPNVLLLMTDQQRWDTLGCTGNRVIETANLDWIASQGTVFTHAYTSTPSCVPARTTLLSGMDPWHTGVLGTGRMGGGFAHTMPGELAKGGYQTQGIGKMNFQPQRALNGFHHTLLEESGRVEDPGFVSDYKRWFDEHKTGDYDMTDHGLDWNSWMCRPFHAPEFLHPVNWTASEAIKFLDRRDPTMPFFLKMSFARPHSPYDALPYYFDLYMDKELPKPYVGDWASVHDVPEDAASPDAWRGKRSDEEIHRARAGYYGLIHHIDHQIGRVLMHLKKHKLLDNTLILFLSDHGDMLGDHHLWRKTHGYEGASHIPLIVRLPKTMERQVRGRVEEPVCLQDIMPTILDAAGLPIPETVDGRSLLPIMENEAAPWRDYVHGEHRTCYSELQEMHYLTDGRWKYIWLPRADKEQLFDLEADPGECRDLASSAEHAKELAMWRKRLVAELEPRGVGLTDGESLVCQAGRPPIVSPHYQERIDRWHRERLA
ncbi:arylsulfatase [Paenibacillus sp. J31TS4]|uniref:arylsulfatase n=1 Tax=Paenibacillus sp. J31TS4 TaxID=2807195 RepID=UPI001B2C7876|nr:arylsulfatase [Paenibacillus sp. J31TS4]GIP38434.1 arylsulfatase [Paenibacillus sp. J31TS4]